MCTLCIIKLVDGGEVYQYHFNLPNSFLFLGPTKSGKTTTFVSLFKDPENFIVETDHGPDHPPQNQRIFRNIVIVGSYATSPENVDKYTQLFKNAKTIVLFPCSTLDNYTLRNLRIIFCDMKAATDEMPVHKKFRLLNRQLLHHLAETILPHITMQGPPAATDEQDLFVLDDCQLPSDAFKGVSNHQAKLAAVKNDPFADFSFQSFLSRDIHHANRSLVLMQQAPGGPLQSYFYQNTPYMIQQIRGTLPDISWPIIMQSGILRGMSPKERSEANARLKETIASIKADSRLINQIPFGVWKIRGMGQSAPILAFHYDKSMDNFMLNKKPYFSLPNFAYFTF